MLSAISKLNYLGVKMPEFTGTMSVTVEVTIKAKNRKKAESFFDDLYLNISIENDGNQEIEILNDNTDLIENDWEIED
ncbi:unnamed protein product [Microcystis aeruginosa NIES-298]|nr:unnamed protein product [Microcystis aeruginosa NIES-298]